MNQSIHLNTTISEELQGKRLDVALAALFPQYSRSQIQQWIKNGKVKLGGETVNRSKDKVMSQQTVEIETELESKENWQAQEIPLNIVFEDDSILVINKPMGLTVHPGAGTRDQTLVNALVYHSPELSLLPRAGLIHRLDKQTTGLLVIAKTLEAHTALVRDLQKRKIKREYEAIIHGELIAGGTINAPIGRHPTHRTRMCVTDSGKEAITHYRVIEKFKRFTRVLVELETGRTHQIRVHFAHLGYPIAGDPTYNARRNIPGFSFKRQALHAIQLSLIHPKTKKMMSWQAPLPEDMQEFIEWLRTQ